MALHILHDVSSKTAGSLYYSIMADECMDVSNKEQFTVNIRWMDEDLKEHESFIGLYQVSLRIIYGVPINPVSSSHLKPSTLTTFILHVTLNFAPPSTQSPSLQY